jgi:hypothetical protein
MVISFSTGAIALRTIRKYELCGTGFAISGMIASVFFCAIAPIWHAALFKSESPAGYMRVDFAALTKGSDQSLQQYVGKRICLKGYALAMGPNGALQSLVLSPDDNNRKIEAAVVIKLGAEETWTWRAEPLAVSGILMPNPFATDAAVPRFILSEPIVRSSRTPCGLARRVPGKGC